MRRDLEGDFPDADENDADPITARHSEFALATISNPGGLALLVGELNPYGSDYRYALFPHPRGSAGYRLAFNVLGMPRGQYVRRFGRVNLCEGSWSMRAARLRAGLIEREGGFSKYVLCGARVAAAFDVEFRPFELDFAYRGGRGHDYAVLPHPSGRCRLWNEPGAYRLARETVRRLVPEVFL